MTIDEAIKHAEEVAEEHTKYNRYGGFESCDKCGEEHRQLAEWLKELKWLREQTRWIPVSERLPKYNKTVLISVKQKGKENTVFTAQRRRRVKTSDIFKCCADNDGWWDFRMSAWDDHEVIAWMPLPEPMKVGEENC